MSFLCQQIKLFGCSCFRLFFAVRVDFGEKPRNRLPANPCILYLMQVCRRYFCIENPLHCCKGRIFPRFHPNCARETKVCFFWRLFVHGNGVKPGRLTAAPRGFSGKSSMQDLSAKGLFSVIASYGTFLINALFFWIIPQL